MVPSQDRWNLRPGASLPRVGKLLANPPSRFPRRFRTGIRDDAWQRFDPKEGSKGTRVTFDWGEPVAGYLNLTFREMPATLVYFGLEPPEPRNEQAQALARSFSAPRTWIDASARRFRYVTVVGNVRVTGARVDVLGPNWAERLAIR